MRQIFCIREKKTSTWCISSKHRNFSNNFEESAIFLKEDNAAKAIKEMYSGMDPKKSTGPCRWYVFTETKIENYTPLLERTDSYTALLEPEFEIVHFNLIENK